MVSVANTPPYCCSAKTGTDDTQTSGQGYVPIKLYLQKQAASQQALYASLFLLLLLGENLIAFHSFSSRFKIQDG